MSLIRLALFICFHKCVCFVVDGCCYGHLRHHQIKGNGMYVMSKSCNDRNIDILEFSLIVRSGNIFSIFKHHNVLIK